MKYLFLILSLLLSPAVTTSAKKYTWEYDYKKLEKEANKGDLWAQYWMGRTFEEGRLSQIPDDTKAFEWYLKAAQQNHAASQYAVAMRYLNGIGVTRDEEEFIHWLKAAANNTTDNEETFMARINLAKLMREGKYGLKKDVEQAIKIANSARLPYMDLSGKSYDMYAMQSQILGNLYFDKASKSLEAADYGASAKHFEEEAQAWERWTTSKQTQANENAAEAWGKSMLAWLMHETYSDIQNYSNMIKAAYNAAKKGYPGAIYLLGEGYYFGEFNLPQDKDKGLSYLTKIENSNPKAAYIIASSNYEAGNYERALSSFSNLTQMSGVAPAALSDAYRKLSSMHRFGRGTTKDERKADSYISKAAELGDADAEKIKEWLKI